MADRPLTPDAIALLRRLAACSYVDQLYGISLDPSPARSALIKRGLITKRRANAGHNHWGWMITQAGDAAAEEAART